MFATVGVQQQEGMALSEHALSIVVDNANNEAIAERDALLAKIEALEAECKRLRGEGEEDGRFAIATYICEQHFRIPDDATSWEIKWGVLHYRTADGEALEAPPIGGETFEDLKRPTAVRCVNESWWEEGADEDSEAESDV